MSGAACVQTAAHSPHWASLVLKDGAALGWGCTEGGSWVNSQGRGALSLMLVLTARNPFKTICQDTLDFIVLLRGFN